MKKISKYLFMVGFILMNAPAGHAGELCFDDIFEKARKNSHDLKLSNIEIEISKTQVKEQKSNYFPTLYTNMGADYSNDLTDGNSIYTSVGEQIVATNTRFQNLVSLGMSYNLFDFGIRKRKLNIAKKDVDLKNLLYQKNLRELKLELIDVYTNALLSYKSMKAKQKIQELNKELLTMQERLYKAGTIAKVAVANQQLQVHKYNQEITTLKKNLLEALEELKFYTNENYDLNEIENIKGFEANESEDGIVPINLINANQPIEYKLYEIEIKKKQYELEAVFRENLPQLKMYSRYGWYGSDKTNYGDSFQALDKTSATLGISASMPIFDGFKNKARREKLKLEIDKLKIMQDRSLKEFEKRQKKFSSFINIYGEEKEDFGFLLKTLDEKIDMITRLTEQQLLDRTKIKEQEIELISTKHEFEKIMINLNSSIESLKVLSSSDL